MIAELAAWPYQVEPIEVVVSLTVPGQPMPKQRPRFSGKGWAYSGQRSRHYEKIVRDALALATRFRGADNKSAFALRCRFYRSDRIRCDVDNLVKSVADAANGIVWADDSQVVELHARLFKACAEPRAEVLIYRVRVE